MDKILIIDDSETLRKQVRGALETGGFQVVEGTDGVDGLEKVSQNIDIKLILCDVNMPNMDGLTMCQKLFELPNLVKPPILMLTTEANPDMKAKGKAAGVIAWITKPFVEDQLLGAVKKILRK